MTLARTLPSKIDLWAPVPFDALPVALLEASQRSDWKTVRDELRKVMDNNPRHELAGRVRSIGGESALLHFQPNIPDSE